MDRVDDILKPVPVDPEPAPKVHKAPAPKPIPAPEPPAPVDDEIPKLAKKALDNLHKTEEAPKPAEDDDSVSTLARRAIQRLEGLGGSSDGGDEVPHLAKKALKNINGSSDGAVSDDVPKLAKKALDNLNSGKPPSDQVKALARKALKEMEEDKKGADDNKDNGEIESLAKKALANVKKNGGKVPDEVKTLAKNALKEMDEKSGGSKKPAELKQKPIAQGQADCGGDGCSIEELTDRVLQMPGTGRAVDNENDAAPSVPELARRALDHMEGKNKITTEEDKKEAEQIAEDEAERL